MNPLQNTTVNKQSTPFAANVFFALLLASMSIYFIWWGLDYTLHQQVILFLVATFFGIFMAFNIGGNDVANSFGTSVGAGTLTVTQALAVAAIFEVSGAVFAGAAVTDTIRSGIVDLNGLDISPNQFIYVMLSALIAAAFWILFATKKGLPVSTTHAIIGGIVGSSIVLGINAGGTELAFSTVKWSKITSIAVSWVLSPLLGGVMSYVLYNLIKNKILNYNSIAESKLKDNKARKDEVDDDKNTYLNSLPEPDRQTYEKQLLDDEKIHNEPEFIKGEREKLKTKHGRQLYDLKLEKRNIDPLKALQTWVPIIAAFGSMIMTSLVVFKALKNTGLNLSTLHAWLVMAMVGTMIWLVAYAYTKSIKGKHIKGKYKGDLSKATFIIFGWMQVFTACAFAFSHGSNDIANAVGPFMAILDVIRTNTIEAKALVPTPVIITFGIALMVGLWFIGKEVIQTVGTNLTEMHPASGFAAELAAAAVVMGASAIGIPVSSTHILVGAVVGIGVANKNTNWKLMRPIALAWVITLPASLVMSSIAFIVLNSVF